MVDRFVDKQKGLSYKLRQQGPALADYKEEREQHQLPTYTPPHKDPIQLAQGSGKRRLDFLSLPQTEGPQARSSAPTITRLATATGSRSR